MLPGCTPFSVEVEDTTPFYHVVPKKELELELLVTTVVLVTTDSLSGNRGA